MLKPKIELPRRISHRNPFDPVDVQVAMSIIRQVFATTITRNTAKELDEIGIDPNKHGFGGKVKILDKITSEVAMIGAFYIASNMHNHFACKVVVCKSCQSRLQVSAANDPKITQFLCCFCAADHALNQYWSKKDRKTNKNGTISKEKRNPR